MSRVLILLKEFCNLIHAAKIVKYTAVILLSAAIVTVMLFNAYMADLNRGLSEHLIRLHVIANSDSPEDQALKRDVRDAVLAFMQKELKTSKDIDQTKSIVTGSLDHIADIAKDTVTSRGSRYDVVASLGSYPFPTKAYGDITLPAGTYQALRIVIGKGEGANWWCVLFPPLCFVDVTHGTVPDSVKADLQKVLTDEEYSVITSADEESDIPIKIKFKVVELLEDSKVKFAGALSRLFKTEG